MATTMRPATSDVETQWDLIFGNTANAETKPAEELTPPPVEKTTPDIAQRVLSADEIQDVVFTGAEPEKTKPAVTTTESVEKTTEPVAIKKAETAKADESETDLDIDQYTKQVFKHAAQQLINKGIWQDVEGFEDMELDETSYAELAQMQVEHQLNEAWNKIKESDEVINGILSVIESGGNPDSIIDLFKEQKALSAIDTATPAGKLQIIGKFYEDIVGLKPAQVQQKLRKLEMGADEDLQSEFSLAEEKYNEHFTAEKQRLQLEQQQQQAREEELKRSQINATYQALIQQGTHQQTAKKLIESIYQPAWKMPNGDTLSDFDYKLMQIRNNPQQNIELARFIMNPENYIQSKTQQQVNKSVDETFGRLKFQPRKSSGIAAKAATPGNNAEVTKALYKGL